MGEVAALQEVKGLVAMETCCARASGKTATAFGVGFVLHAPFCALERHHFNTVFCRIPALQALLPAPLTALVQRGAGCTLKVTAPGKRSPSGSGSGPVAEVCGTHGLGEADDHRALAVAHGPVGLLFVGTASGHHLQLLGVFPFPKHRGSAEVLAQGTLLHQAVLVTLALHALQALGGWDTGRHQHQQQGAGP